MPNGRCRMHGGKSPGAPKGNKNAFKDGRYTAEAVANRREIAELLRAIKTFARLRSSYGWAGDDWVRSISIAKKLLRDRRAGAG